MPDLSFAEALFTKYEKEYHYEQTKRIYLNRAVGGNCHYCIVDGDIDARTPAGQGAGTDNLMQE